MVIEAQGLSRAGLFTHHPLFSTTDPAVAQQLGSQALSPYTLNARGDQPFSARLSGVDLNRSRMLLLEYSDEIEVESTQQLDYYVLVVVVEGRMTIQTDHGETIVSAGGAGVISPPTHVRLTFAAGTQELCLKIPRDTLNRHLASFFTHVAGSRPVFELAPTRPPVWAPNLVVAAHALGNMSEGAARDGLAIRLERGLFDTLLLTQRHSISADLLAASDPPRVRGTVNEIARQFTEHPELSYSMAQIATEHGMSVRSMQHRFQAEFGTTPTAFLLDARLDRAHELLAEGSTAPSVSAVAYAAGFSQLGRFSQAYRRRFGRSPRQTLAMNKL